MFDFNDPFGLNQGADPFRDPMANLFRPRAAVQPLPPDEQESALSRLGQNALGGLGWVGESLDKGFGGRTIRGLLGGKGLGALAHLIPFSDTAGWTSPHDVPSGKELLGYSPHDDSWSGFGAGLAAEIALDPATYLTLGGSALSKLGKAAEKAGTLPKGLAARARGFAAASPEAAELARLTGQSIPEVAGKPLGGAAAFMGNVLGGEKAAGALDAAKDYLTYSRVGRTVAPLFDNSLHTFGPAPTSEAGQRAVRDAAERLNAKRPEILGGHFAELKRLEDAGLHDEASTLRRLAEGMNGPMPAGQQELMDSAGRINQTNEKMLADAQRMGLPVSDLQDPYAKYTHRQVTAENLPTGGPRPAADRGFPTVGAPQQISREADLRGVPGGSEMINDLMADPLAVAAGTKRQKARARSYVREQIGFSADPARKGGKAELDALELAKPPKTITDPAGNILPNPDFERLQELRALKKKGSELANRAAELPDTYRDEGLRYFGNHVVGDQTSSLLSHQRSMEGAEAFYRMLTDTAAPAGSAAAAGGTSIADIIKGSRLTTTRDAAGQLQGAIPQIIDRLQQKGILPPGPVKPSALKNIMVPSEVAADVTRYGQSFAIPESLKPIISAWDSVTNLTKAGQTVTWPAFHARNFMSGLWQNLVGGATYPGGDLISGLRDAHTLRSGGVLADANKIPGFTHLSPQDASRQILELAYAHGARIPADRTLGGEILGRLPHELGAGEMTSFAGRVEKSPLQSLKEGVGLAADPTNLGSAGGHAGGMLNPMNWGRGNPLGINGIMGNTADTFAPVKAGREIAHASDDYNRLAGFLGYLRQGYAPDVAAMRTKALHFDYGNMAPFEREVMRRLIPFYSWSRNNLPFQLEQLIQKPGGLVANAATAAGELRQQSGLLPDWIGEGMAMPVGNRDDQGNQRYLSSFGLPFEDINNIVSTGPHAVQRTMQKMLGDLNPLIKAPLEYATGQQFYSGRQLDDLYSRTGSPLADQIIMNGPLSRALTMASTAADPRKGLTGFATNFLSPFRVTDVDMNRARSVQGRRLLEEELRQDPNVKRFENFYISPDQAQTLDPQTLQLLRLYRTLLDQAKAAKAAQQVQPAGTPSPGSAPFRFMG